MAGFEQFYDINPIGVIDRNKWDLKMAEVNLQFQNNAVYTPLIDWDASPMETGAVSIEQFELFEGEVDSNPIPETAMYLEQSMGIDSRSRKWTVTRYGDKVQLYENSNIFNMWRISGQRDWRPLLRNLLGWNVLEKHEILARNVWFRGSKRYWTYAGSATSLGTIGADDTFSIDAVKDWNLWLGNTGSPIIPGASASAKIATVPPGAVYDFVRSVPPATTGTELAMWRDAAMYGGRTLNYEIGSYLNVRFIEVPSNKFGINKNVLYNAGAISKQYGVTQPIRMGDGAPDPETTPVDEVWYVGQKGATHYIQLEDFAATDFAVNDFVTIHVKRTNEYGVTGGVDPFDGKTIVRRVVEVDNTNKRLVFDRPILFNYTSGFVGSSVSGGTTKTLYAYVTKGRNIGFSLVLGSRGGVQGKVIKPIRFYEPKPIDDFESVWRFTWDEWIGYNIADPNFFTLYFYNVSIPKPGGSYIG